MVNFFFFFFFEFSTDQTSDSKTIDENQRKEPVDVETLRAQLEETLSSWREQGEIGKAEVHRCLCV